MHKRRNEVLVVKVRDGMSHLVLTIGTDRALADPLVVSTVSSHPSSLKFGPTKKDGIGFTRTACVACRRHNATCGTILQPCDGRTTASHQPPAMHQAGPCPRPGADAPYQSAGCLAAAGDPLHSFWPSRRRLKAEGLGDRAPTAALIVPPLCGMAEEDGSRTHQRPSDGPTRI